MPETELERDLELLRREYRGKLPRKLAELGELLQGARRGGDLAAARRLAHNLKGTSGSYGFRELSAEFQRIEEGLDRLLESAPTEVALAWDRIGHALSRARDQLALPEPPGSPDGA